jgi:hypothetical protein
MKWIYLSAHELCMTIEAIRELGVGEKILF